MKGSKKKWEKLKEDLEFTRRTEEALEQVEKGKCKTMDFDKFLKELKEWAEE